ncbi:MAG: hypothetical protein H7A21_16430 [Spirochaetales bacterium]|nr:hypothetical protein [Leptospiraceae bacterium]MCP5483024.1 hypothetical protein [Spirochaetales bacterium]MCP5486170.1 hypothetical protein [Spirochaetales bacterium]
MRTNVYSGDGGGFLARLLDEFGHKIVFSIPGAQLLSIWDALGRDRRLQLVVPASEWSGGFQAEGYALASGRPAIVLDTLGPGVANELPAMASARLGKRPVLYISPIHPAQKRARLGRVFQGLDTSKLLGPQASYTLRVESAEQLPGHLELARRLCLGESFRSAEINIEVPAPGPVRLEIEYPFLFRRLLARIPALPLSETRPAEPEAGLYVAAGAIPRQLRPMLRGLEATCIANGLGVARYNIDLALGFYLARNDCALIWPAGDAELQAATGSLMAAIGAGLPLYYRATGPIALLDAIGVARATEGGFLPGITIAYIK